MRMMRQQRPLRPGGFSLIEMMIALAVLAIGLLGVASLTTNSLRVGHQASVYSQSMFKAQELAEKIMANRPNKDFYVLNFGETGEAGIPLNKCIEASCSGADMARWEVKVWRAELASALPGADAEVTVNDDQAVITIRMDTSRGVDNPEELVYQVAL